MIAQKAQKLPSRTGAGWDIWPSMMQVFQDGWVSSQNFWFIWMFPKIRGSPKWMVYNGKPYQNGWFGGKTPLFSETSISYQLGSPWKITKVGFFSRYQVKAHLTLSDLHENSCEVTTTYQKNILLQHSKSGNLNRDQSWWSTIVPSVELERLFGKTRWVFLGFSSAWMGVMFHVPPSLMEFFLQGTRSGWTWRSVSPQSPLRGGRKVDISLAKDWEKWIPIGW